MILSNTNKNNKSSKSEMEMVEEQKQEYYLLGQFSRTPSLRLFSYNPNDETLVEVIISYSDTINTALTKRGWITYDKEEQKATVDSRFIYFEALNESKAKARVGRYKNDLTSLCNMKPVRDGSINFFNN